MSDLPAHQSTDVDSKVHEAEGLPRKQVPATANNRQANTNQAEMNQAGTNRTGTSPPPSSQTDGEKAFHAYPFYAPRFWHGMRPLAWVRLVRHGRFRFSLGRFPHAIGVSLACGFNTLLAGVQQILFSRKLAAAEFHGPPVFIIGHWRSGTTLLHELMVRDERLSSPSTYQCFAPHHFLLTEWVFRKFFPWLLPGKRPMDNMQAGWERPQEDEFALMNLGQPSPYRRIAFPNEGPVDTEYLNFDGVGEQEVQSWLATLRKFLLTVSYVSQRPLVIKSPTHTGRIKQLAKEFPEARFIHMTRDPRALFPSTRRLWRGLCEAQSLQEPTHSDEDEYVNDCFRRMYDTFEQDCQSIDEHRLIHIRYEELAEHPVDTLKKIYSALRLSDFETVRPSIEDWVETEHKSYKTNQHSLSSNDEALIQQNWKQYADRYGYPL